MHRTQCVLFFSIFNKNILVTYACYAKKKMKKSEIGIFL